MSDIIGYWEDEHWNETPVYGEPPPPLDSTPFTREARQLEHTERELRIGAIAVEVGKLTLQRAEVRQQLTQSKNKRRQK
jgi:hypothetical protein